MRKGKRKSGIIMSPGFINKLHSISQCFLCKNGIRPRSRTRGIFSGSNENLLKNGRLLLEERISLFDGKTNPIRCFSVDELNTMCPVRITDWGEHKAYRAVWDGRSVLIKLFAVDGQLVESPSPSREIAVATEMGTHNNVHKLLGCCLETCIPVLVYEWVDVNGTLRDRICRDRKQDLQPLQWKDRLRIAWEISHAISYLHTAFRRPIVHRDLRESIVFLDQDNAAKLSDFSAAVSIPEGKEYTAESLIGTWGLLAPEYAQYGKVAESTDVYSFGMLFLVVLTGKNHILYTDMHGVGLLEWVRAGVRDKCLDEIVDPLITTNEHIQQQLRASIGLALRCTADNKDSRPTMEEVATELKNMITSSESIHSSSH